MGNQSVTYNIDALLQDISFGEVMQELAPYLYIDNEDKELVYVFRADFSKPLFLLAYELFNNAVEECTTSTAKRPYRAKEKRKKSQYIIASIEKVLSVA